MCVLMKVYRRTGTRVCQNPGSVLQTHAQLSYRNLAIRHLTQPISIAHVGINSKQTTRYVTLARCTPDQPDQALRYLPSIHVATMQRQRANSDIDVATSVLGPRPLGRIGESQGPPPSPKMRHPQTYFRNMRVQVRTRVYMCRFRLIARYVRLARGG